MTALNDREWEAVARAGGNLEQLAFARGMSLEAVEMHVAQAEERMRQRQIADEPGTLMTKLLRRDNYHRSNFGQRLTCR